MAWKWPCFSFLSNTTLFLTYCFVHSIAEEASRLLSVKPLQINFEKFTSGTSTYHELGSGLHSWCFFFSHLTTTKKSRKLTLYWEILQLWHACSRQADRLPGILTRLINQSWEFINENKKVRKQENTLSAKKVIKKKKKKKENTLSTRKATKKKR